MGRKANTEKNSTRATILRTIRRAGQISRKDVAELVGLTPAAVTMVTAELVKDGLLIERGFDYSDTKTGRKKVLLAVNDQYRYVFTISIDTVRVVCGISDIGGNLKQKLVFPVDRKMEPEKLLKTAAGILKSMQNELKLKLKQMAGVGVVIPGVVDEEHRESLSDSGVFKARVDIAGILEEEMGLPVFVENNVRAFAQAELLYGKNLRLQNVLFVKWGPGVGSVLALDGVLMKGSSSAGIGNILSASTGVIALDEDEKAGSAVRLSEQVSDSAIMKKMAESANHDMTGVMEECTKSFALALANSMMILIPDRVVLHGKFFRDNSIRLALWTELMRLAPELEGVVIEYSEFADREDYIGACAAYSEEHIYR